MNCTMRITRRRDIALHCVHSAFIQSFRIMLPYLRHLWCLYDRGMGKVQDKGSKSSWRKHRPTMYPVLRYWVHTCLGPINPLQMHEPPPNIDKVIRSLGHTLWPWIFVGTLMSCSWELIPLLWTDTKNGRREQRGFLKAGESRNKTAPQLHPDFNFFSVVALKGNLPI